MYLQCDNTPASINYYQQLNKYSNFLYKISPNNYSYKRILKEVKDIENNHSSKFEIKNRFGDNCSHYVCLIRGEKDSVYEGGCNRNGFFLIFIFLIFFENMKRFLSLYVITN